MSCFIRALLTLDREKIDQEGTVNDILNWLTPVNSWAKQYDTFQLWKEGTLTWVWEDGNFQDWMNGTATLLCIGDRNSKFG